MDDSKPDEELSQAPIEDDPRPEEPAGEVPVEAAVEDGNGTRGLAAVGRELSRLVELFQERLAYDGFKEEQITRLHQELQDHRRDLLGRALRPLLAGLVRIHDELDRARESMETGTPEELTPEGVARLLEGFQDDVVLLLDQHGVARTESSGDRFEPRHQTAIRRIPTADGALVGRIARRLRPGFVLDGTPLRKERVEVFVADAEAPPITPEGAGSPAPRDVSHKEPQ